MAAQLGERSDASAAQNLEPPSGNTQDAASSLDDGVGDKTQPGTVSMWGKIKQHFLRRWWIYLIAIVVLLVILLPVLFKVIIPAIIKNIVDGQELPVKGGFLNFTDPTRLRIGLDTSLDTPLPVKLDPVSLSLLQPPVDGADDIGTPFLTLQMPEQHINHETDVVIPSQVVDVLDHAHLVAWFNEFFDKEGADLRLKGDDLSVYLGALDYRADLDKTIKVPGLDYLKGFGVSDMQFTIPPGPSGHNMKGHLNIPNAGVLTLGLGNVTFNVMAGDINLGLVYIYNLDLKPGNNTPPFEGDFYFDQLVPNLATFLETQRGALANGMVEFNATGNSTFHNGQRIRYVESVLNRKHIPFTIPATTLLLDVLSGVLASGTDGPGLPLLDTVGDVMGNKTLFEQMLDHFDPQSIGSGAQGMGNGVEVTDTTQLKRRAMAQTAGRSMQVNLLRLGLRTLRSKF
ncbi:uncharacterized protein B0H64DRAFT_408926 [Chaetomium fimeti]|uniref:Uncharacterized protein n=1 Tax=Chaetomium fimeti TaxID=1854472 RepID=A0AAE0H7Q9_9PEZI|nr:hypothetical protein B0H64DRAFT_408926 [Chaetomium fimeti]